MTNKSEKAASNTDAKTVTHEDKSDPAVVAQSPTLGQAGTEFYPGQVPVVDGQGRPTHLNSTTSAQVNADSADENSDTPNK